jgi:ribosomal protein S18 acetylase RimI-like enzyme
LAEGASEVEAMVGDTNLFLAEAEGGKNSRSGSHDMVFLGLNSVRTAEAEIMIAEVINVKCSAVQFSVQESARGKGFGRQALLLMLRYGAERLGLGGFEAKIKVDNTPSIKLFTKIGFTEVSRSEVFEEVTLTWEAGPAGRAWLQEEAPWQLHTYTHSEEGTSCDAGPVIL